MKDSMVVAWICSNLAWICSVKRRTDVDLVLKEVEKERASVGRLFIGEQYFLLSTRVAIMLPLKTYFVFL